MRALNRIVGALIAVLLLAFAAAAFADGDGEGDGPKPPEVVSAAPTEVTATSAVLQGYVKPRGQSTTYVFEHGATTAYGTHSAPASAGNAETLRLVSTRINGLQPGSTYHYRVVATSSKGTTRGADHAFTTPPTPSQPQASAPPPPRLGTSVTVVVGRGVVRVRTPGTSHFVPLTAGSELPVGSEVDTRRGTVVLSAALPSGRIQTGRFAGGRFRIRQRQSGYVDLHLRGRVCPPRRRARPSEAQRSTLAVAARTRKRRAGRRLWGRDRGGRFRTRGRNSHATVRGTRWLVADRCNGTLTRVTEGSVIVRDTVKNKRLTLRAGDSYFARARR